MLEIAAPGRVPRRRLRLACEQTTKALFGFERKIDSASSPATSSSPLRLAAVKLVVQVAHIEFGLRCFNRVMPQEHNCVLTDYLTDILLAHSGGGDPRPLHSRAHEAGE